MTLVDYQVNSGEGSALGFRSTSIPRRPSLLAVTVIPPLVFSKITSVPLEPQAPVLAPEAYRRMRGCNVSVVVLQGAVSQRGIRLNFREARTVLKCDSFMAYIRRTWLESNPEFSSKLARLADAAKGW